MDSNQHEMAKEKAVEKKKHEEEKLKRQEQESLAAKQQQSSPTSLAPASPPSASSSPSHEFSFTISLHSSSNTVPDKTKPPPSFAIDLSPADDIFFHGHLLPLHLLSHLPVSPRSSTNSMDSFTLPIRELTDDQKNEIGFSNCSTGNNSDSNMNNNIKNTDDKTNHHQQNSNDNDQTKGRGKSKSFSLFGFTRWRKGYQVGEREDNNKEKQKKKLRFEVSHVLKRYVSKVRPLLFFRERRENLHFQRQPYSFSGNLSFRNKQELRGKRGQFSAPASIRTSPTNSGLLVATKTLPSSTSDSTMEELQAAIQAAIAHCKKSIAVEEKLKC